MPTNLGKQLAGWLPQDPQQRRMLRFAIGTTLAMAFAAVSGMPVGYLIPVLTVSLLGNSQPCLDVSSGLKIIVLIAGSALFGLLFSAATLRYPLPCMLLVILLLFRIFYSAAKGAPAIVSAMLLIAITMVPVVALTHQALALMVAGGLATAGLFAVFFLWLSHTLVPDLGTDAPAAQAPKPDPISEADATRSALISTSVVAPAVVLFYYWGITSHLLTLVFICLLALNPNLQKSGKGALALLLANFSGGLVALLLFQLLVAMPELTALIIFVFATALLFSQRLFSDRPTAPLYATAFSTVLLLIGSTTGDFGGDADEKFYARIIGIGLAAVYVIFGFVVVAIFSPKAREHIATPKSQTANNADA
ncbi:DUF2955 domain-containing protein [Corallincola platygyrae]|uniref:DUF2955 domain-containing protein n=1 Tax=Corallincola platygyrae TaxID=1193278 RepID=A0ABW4XNS0_9GAMM